MRGELVLVRDGLDGAAPWLAQSLHHAGMRMDVVDWSELGRHRPADAVLIKLPDAAAVETCWSLHRQGHRAIIALSNAASSRECIRLLNAGADYYLDAWMPSAELVARLRVVLRFSAWSDRHAPAATA